MFNIKNLVTKCNNTLMKLAYKTSIPIAIIVMVLILLVTYTSNDAQKTIISDGQQLTKTIIFEQLEKNKKEALETRKLEVELFLNDAVQIATDYLEPEKDMWLPEEFINSDDPLALMIQNEQEDVSEDELAQFKEEMNNSLKKLTKYKIIQSVFIKSLVKEKEDVFIGEKTNTKYKTLKQNIYSKNESKKKIGYVELQYSDKFIKEQFDQARDLIVKDLAIKNIEQQENINNILLQQTVFNFAITFLLIIIILTFIKKLVLNPLTKLKNGLNSFFLFLQNTTQNIEPINIQSNDEFGTMGNSLNENIQVASELHTKIHDLNTNLEKKVEERTEQLNERSTKIRQLLDIAAEGFLSFDNSFIIDSEYSKECENIFSQAIAKLNIADLLFDTEGEEKEVFKKTISDIFDPKLPKRRKKVLLRLLKKEFVINDKYINIEYQPVEDQKLILILTDITDKIALEKKLADEKQTLKMIVTAVKDLEEFKDVINEYYEFCNDIPSFITSENNFRENLVLFYRKIHTFKGNFAQKDLLYIVRKLHTFENSLNQLVKNENSTFEQFKTLIQENTIHLWLEDDLQVIEEILDESIVDQEEIIKIAYSLIDNLESKINTLLTHKKEERDITYEDLLEDVLRMKNRSIEEYLAPYVTLTEQLALKLNKPINPVSIKGANDIYVSNEVKPFIKTLVHIFRNSMDHGIELLDQRATLGKPDNASIVCNGSIENENIILSITDDGKGIDPEIIKAKAIEKGIFSAQELDNMRKDEILLIIFEDAFSTNENVTELSGRGIGLGAVKYECERLGGTIKIESEINKGTTFIFTLPRNNIS